MSKKFRPQKNSFCSYSLQTTKYNMRVQQLICCLRQMLTTNPSCQKSFQYLQRHFYFISPLPLAVIPALQWFALKTLWVLSNSTVQCFQINLTCFKWFFSVLNSISRLLSINSSCCFSSVCLQYCSSFFLNCSWFSSYNLSALVLFSSSCFKENLANNHFKRRV